MPTRKLYDLAVKTSTYTDKNGETKGRYENIGSVLQLDDGGKVILIKRSFNPAGVPFKDGSDQIMVSMFEPKDRDAGNTDHGKAKANAYQGGNDDLAF
jgi:hypothetical protein